MVCETIGGAAGTYFYETNIAFNMSKVRFSLHCLNKTPQSWIFGIYINQMEAEHAGLDGIPWKQVYVAGPTGEQIISWTTTYEVCVVKPNPDDPKHYYPTVCIPATPGQFYEAYTDHQGAINLRHRASAPVDKKTSAEEIFNIYNKATKSLNLGIMMDGALIAFNFTKPGLQSQYLVHPRRYYIGCFTTLEPDSGNTSLIPVPCIFPQGKNNATVCARMKENGQYVLEDPNFSLEHPHSARL